MLTKEKGEVGLRLNKEVVGRVHRLVKALLHSLAGLPGQGGDRGRVLHGKKKKKKGQTQ